MDKMTFKFDYWLPNELQDYLLQLNGIKEVDIDLELDILNIFYDSNVISSDIIYMEVVAFLKIQKVPSLLEFNKHSEEKKHEITIKSLCCEYCLKSNLEELLMIKGIESASSDFDYKDKDNVKINVTYNAKVISENDLLELEAKFNN